MAKQQKRKVPKKAKKRIKTKKPKAVKVLVEAMTQARSVGRPVEYNPSFCELADAMCKLGATDIELADFFKIDKATLYRWQASYPEFCDSIRLAKEAANERVERSLYQKATGYTFDSEKLFYDAKTGEVIRAGVREHVPPSDTVMIFFLKNRRPDRWRDKREVENTNTNLNLNTPPQSMQEAQDMFRQARLMSAEELAKAFKIVDGTVVPQVPDVLPVAHVDDADADEEEADEHN